MCRVFKRAVSVQGEGRKEGGREERALLGPSNVGNPETPPDPEGGLVRDFINPNQPPLF